MGEEFQFLTSLRQFEGHIKKLMRSSRASSDGFNLLKNKLDDVCEFMISEEAQHQWTVWGQHEKVQKQVERLREAVVAALCDLEKHQSKCIESYDMNTNKYLTSIIQAVEDELQNFGIRYHSKVLFIGSGALPVSVLTIATNFGAKVMGVDIDSEAIALARNVAKVYEVETLCSFTSENLNNLNFLKETTHIIIASLVADKIKVLQQLNELVNEDVKILLRYGNGIKSIFNYSFHYDFSGEWNQIQHMNQNLIYDTVILQKSSSKNEQKREYIEI